MFDKGKEKYGSDIKIGERYIDPQTGIEGVAVALTFYQYACERAVLEVVVAGKIEEYGFDAPRLKRVDTQEQARAKRPGGPGDPAPARPTGSR